MTKSPRLTGKIPSRMRIITLCMFVCGGADKREIEECALTTPETKMEKEDLDSLNKGCDQNQVGEYEFVHSTVM